MDEMTSRERKFFADPDAWKRAVPDQGCKSVKRKDGFLVIVVRGFPGACAPNGFNGQRDPGSCERAANVNGVVIASTSYRE